jgi:hypothetical protein
MLQLIKNNKETINRPDRRSFNIVFFSKSIIFHLV